MVFNTFLFGSDMIRFRSFWSIMHSLPPFPISNYILGIFMSLKPSAKACQPLGSLPLRCLMTSDQIDNIGPWNGFAIKLNFTNILPGNIWFIFLKTN